VKPLSFGGYYCVGAALARVEAKAARARLAKARQRLCSHPKAQQAEYDGIVLKVWDMKRQWK
jgi:cytochrome P450